MPQTDDRENEQRYSQLYRAAADMIFLRDVENGRITDVNPAACRLLGYSRTELIGKNYFDVLASKEEAEAARRLLEEAVKTGAGTRVGVFQRKDGSLLEAEIRNTPLRAGDRMLSLGIARDLTAQRQLERRALAFYQAFLNSNDYMFYTDREGVIQDVNEAFIRRFGYTREEAVGRKPGLIRSKHSTPSLYRRLWSEILDPTKGFWRGRIINRTKDGEEIPIILSITAVRDERGNIVGFVSSGVDMSEQEELHRLLAQTESLAAVGSMAAVVAHEIRNPLGSIVTAASSISREGLAAKERESLLTVIRKESMRLNETLNQFLQYARPRRLKLEEGDLNETVREVVSMVKADPKLKGKVRILEKLADPAPVLRFDGDGMHQVLWNVIINALQAMEGKGRLTVFTEAPPGRGVVRVEDTGPGIPQKQMDKIFRPFHTTKQQGTGLGLAVAERIVSSHGGQIQVASEEGKGCRFVITLPARQEEK